jgi:hypothetical protein
MTYSYTQISQYLRCPRSYRYRYLDGWKEKDSKASLCFGRCFEKALAALFQGEDSPGAVLFKEWEATASIGILQGGRLGARAAPGIAAAGAVCPGQPYLHPPTFAKHAEKNLAVTSERQRVRGLYRCHRDLWTAPNACWNGRPPRLATQSSPRA